MPKSYVYNCDCIEFMRSLPDKNFDVAVCDPPYGAGNSEVLMDAGKRRFNKTGRFAKYHHKTNNIPNSQNSRIGYMLSERYKLEGRSNPKWDTAPQKEFFDELFRVSKNQIIWGGNYFTMPPTRCFLVWRKTNIVDGFSMAQAEYAWTSFQGNSMVYEQSSIRMPNSGKFHPTEKPQELCGWSDKNFVEEGQTIFDPMMGSQTSRAAAFKMGIDYVGCEIDKYYFEKGCEWFDRECHGITKTKNGNTIIELSLF